jgi:type I restriction enzyme, S subunit
MKTYPKYKPTNIDWIGEIPENWTKRRLGSIIENSELGGNYSSNDEEENIPLIKMGNIGRGIILTQKIDYVDKLEKVDNAHLLKYEDFLFNTRNSLELVGKVAMWRDELKNAVFNSNIMRITFSKYNENSFFCYLFNSFNILESLKLIAKGTTNVAAIYFKDLSQLEIVLPPLPEQQAIVTYLDQKTALIDELIGKKERKIELLKENRTALINHAVTKGLDPTVKYKDSGIEWIGGIPEHWKVIRMKFLSQITTGNRDTKDRKDDGVYPFYVRSQTVERIDSYSFEGEGILTAGDGVGVGKVFHHVHGKFAFHQRVYLLYNFKNILGKYLFEFIKNNFLTTVEDQNAKSTVDSLRLNMLEDFQVTVPVIKEQQLIVDYLETQTSLIDENINLELLKIEKLKEYRQSLISNVVTGKICVLED